MLGFICLWHCMRFCNSVNNKVYVGVHMSLALYEMISVILQRYCVFKYMWIICLQLIITLIFIQYLNLLLFFLATISVNFDKSKALFGTHMQLNNLFIIKFISSLKISVLSANFFKGTKPLGILLALNWTIGDCPHILHQPYEMKTR